MDRIRVLIVDDHTVVRNGIRFSLMAMDDIEVVGEAADGREALRQCELACPDVVLMDMVMPGMGGVEATRAILERCSRAHVIVLTSFQEGSLVQDALQAGAIGYLLKDVGMARLAEAVRAAYVGRSTLATEAVQALAASAARPEAKTFELTEREKEVLGLVVRGRSNSEIAEALTISLSTARFHVSTILSKLGASNRAEASALAVRNRLVD